MPRIMTALVALVIAVTPGLLSAQAKRPMTLDDLFKLKRVSDPQISPDGKAVVYVVGTVDMDGNKITSNLWLAPTRKSEPRQLTSSPKRDGHPRWSPDGKHILFESNRSGESQLWVIRMDGGEARQLTTIATEAGTAIWSPDGKHIAFVSAVYPEYSDKPFAESNALNKKRIDEAAKNPVKARVFSKLFYRHWNAYVEDKRQHLFVMPFNDGKGGEPKDVTPGDRDAYPTSTTFSVGDDFTFSPDSKYLVFTAVPPKGEAWSTNYDICRVPITGGTKDWECLTKDNLAADGAPRFSPDGKRLAYRAQKRPGNEADKWELSVVACDESGTFQGQVTSVTKIRHSVDEFAWAKVWSRNQVGDGFVFAADREGLRSLFAWAPNGDVFVASLSTPGVCGSVSVCRDGTRFSYTGARMDSPVEVYVHGLAEEMVPGEAQVTYVNGALLTDLDRPRPESVTVKGADDVPMQMWILKPPGFDEKKKWPVAYLVHGGPQGAWEDGWSWRWNPSLWAAQGYVVALPNPRGSTGFGQKYVDEISGDWGGKCYEDLLKGLDYLEKLPYVDKDRIGAAGASFGGYMMNWFAVNTGRFKCLITHCSVWNFDSMYGTTDELWFDEHEHGGPPWGKNRHSYEKHSPHRLAGNLGKFKTPMLVIHNDLDFRCPIGQGHELFTALQRQGVPSRFINFPDEGHWVSKPANSRYWHQEVFGWLKKYVPPGPR